VSSVGLKGNQTRGLGSVVKAKGRGLCGVIHSQVDHHTARGGARWRGGHLGSIAKHEEIRSKRVWPKMLLLYRPLFIKSSKRLSLL